MFAAIPATKQDVVTLAKNVLPFVVILFATVIFSILCSGILNIPAEPDERLNMKKIDMIIRNGQVFDSVNAKFEKKDIGIHQGRFVALDEETEASNEVDAEGNCVVPGLIDEHAHLNLYGTIYWSKADTVVFLMELHLPVMVEPAELPTLSSFICLIL